MRLIISIIVSTSSRCLIFGSRKGDLRITADATEKKWTAAVVTSRYHCGAEGSVLMELLSISRDVCLEWSLLLWHRHIIKNEASHRKLVVSRQEYHKIGVLLFVYSCQKARKPFFVKRASTFSTILSRSVWLTNKRTSTENRTSIQVQSIESRNVAKFLIKVKEKVRVSPRTRTCKWKRKEISQISLSECDFACLKRNLMLTMELS